MSDQCTTLAQRLGVTCHVSALRFRVQQLFRDYPSAGAACLEDWLLDVANARGARFVTRYPPASAAFVPPPLTALSNEELVVAICQPHNLDRPQMLRAAAQLISMQAVDAQKLAHWDGSERAALVLGELARQAVLVEADHPVWHALATALPATPLRSPLLHWTRLSVPVPAANGCNAAGWKLVA